MSVLDDTVSELLYFRTTCIHGYNDPLFSYSLDKLEPYTMLDFFSGIRDALQELKDLQMDSGGRDTLLGTGRDLGSTLESIAERGSSIKKVIGGATHDTINGVGDLDEKVVTSLAKATSNVIESTGDAVKD